MRIEDILGQGTGGTVIISLNSCSNVNKNRSLIAKQLLMYDIGLF